MTGPREGYLASDLVPQAEIRLQVTKKNIAMPTNRWHQSNLLYSFLTYQNLLKII